MDNFEMKHIIMPKVYKMTSNINNIEVKETFDTCIKYIDRVIKYSGKLGIPMKWLQVQKAKLTDNRFRFLTKNIINKQINDM